MGLLFTFFIYLELYHNYQIYLDYTVFQAGPIFPYFFVLLLFYTFLLKMPYFHTFESKNIWSDQTLYFSLLARIL